MGNTGCAVVVVRLSALPPTANHAATSMTGAIDVPVAKSLEPGNVFSGIHGLRRDAFATIFEPFGVVLSGFANRTDFEVRRGNPINTAIPAGYCVEEVGASEGI